MGQGYYHQLTMDPIVLPFLAFALLWEILETSVPVIVDGFENGIIIIFMRDMSGVEKIEPA